MHRNIANLMNKEMDRKAFLQYAVGVLLAVIGVTGLLNTLFGSGNSHQDNNMGGYGGNVYGR